MEMTQETANFLIQQGLTLECTFDLRFRVFSGGFNKRLIRAGEGATVDEAAAAFEHNLMNGVRPL